MPLSNIMVTAVALAMDAFAVAIATGVCLQTVSPRQTFRLSYHFGFFQAMMPVMGWYAGVSVRGFIESFDHWVAAGLLVFVGGNMIREAFETEEAAQCPLKDPTKGLSLVMLSAATSMDALAVGLGFSVLKISIWAPALCIGITATGFTILGLYIGKTVGGSSRVGFFAEIGGGIILLCIALNILYSNGVFPF